MNKILILNILLFQLIFSYKIPALIRNNPQNTAASVIKILPLGNSITFDNRNNDTRNVGEKAGYRYPLYTLLKNSGYNFDYIGSEHSGGQYLPAGYDENAGFPGITDDQLLNLLKTGKLEQKAQGIERQITAGPYLNTYSPDIILLHIGTNNNEIPGGTSSLEVEQILDEIDQFELSSGKVVTVLLARIIDRVPNENFVNIFNNNVEIMALDRVNNPSNPAYPDNIVIVDMQDSAGINYVISPDPEGAPGDMHDSAHPNNNGYVKMAQQWFKAIRNILPSPPIIVSNPESQYVMEGSEVVFTVNAESEESLSYQWRKNGANIPLANKSYLTISNVNLLDDNSEYSCLVTNINGSVVSNSAKLFVNNSNSRIIYSLISEYNFQEGSGNVIKNVLGNELLDLKINNPTSVSWIEGGIQLLNPADISTDNSATDISDSIKNSNSFTFELWVKTNDKFQNGPARIVTLSNSDLERNFTVGQNSDRFNIRTRTTETNLDGIPDFETENGVITDELSHIIISRDQKGIEKLYINGIASDSVTINGELSNWNSNYKLAIGNEFQSNKSWLGTIYHLAIYNRNLSDDEVLHNYTLGENGITSIKETKFNSLDNFELYQNYPNPFNPSTNISFSLAKDSKVNLSIHNVLGQLVATVVDEKIYKAGTSSIQIFADKLVSGIYFYKIYARPLDNSKPFQKTKKFILLK